MLFLLSPAKSLDYDTPPQVSTHTQPLFTRQSAALIDVLKTKTPQDISSMMKLSDALSGLNVGHVVGHGRYKDGSDHVPNLQ